MPIFCGTGDSAAGRTIRLADNAAVGTIRVVHVEGAGGAVGFDKHKSLITRVTVSQQGNYQFLHTLGNDVYIYVFGDRIGEVTIARLSVPVDCVKEGTSKIGAELLFDWYKENRVAVRASPVTITIGVSTVIKGFVTALSMDTTDPATGIFQWTMQMVVLPDKEL